jgi:hypothetical protein
VSSLNCGHPILSGSLLTPSQVTEKQLDLKVAHVEGDNLLSKVQDILGQSESLQHFDAENPHITLDSELAEFAKHPDLTSILSANAYLGARAIRRGLDGGADIIVCGRVADASPVIGLATWWHGWPESAYDELAGALVAGHLIECSTYVTGANFAEFYKYEIQDLLNLVAWACPLSRLSPVVSAW